jgi:hypothetical protein
MLPNGCADIHCRVGPFYGILPNIFSMDFGGSESCGTVGALLSGMGSLCAMMFNFAAGRYERDVIGTH